MIVMVVEGNGNPAVSWLFRSVMPHYAFCIANYVNRPGEAPGVRRKDVAK